MAKLHLRKGIWFDGSEGWLFLSARAPELARDLEDNFFEEEFEPIDHGWIISPLDAQALKQTGDICLLCAAEKHCQFVTARLSSLDSIPFIFPSRKGNELFYGGDCEAYKKRREEHQSREHEAREAMRAARNVGEAFQEFHKRSASSSNHQTEPFTIPLNEWGEFLYQAAKNAGNRARAAIQSQQPDTEKAAAILGVSPKASAQEIQQAYRKAAFENHPDRNQGNKEAEERFKKAVWAKEILLG
jgi:DnaJ-domain-containing protein 1